ncbi:MAG: rhomboid family intramembrane serine protease [Myxococcota bacterium]
MIRHCPRCVVALERRELGPLWAEVCPRCRGALYEPSQLTRETGIDLARLEARAGMSRTESSLRCPVHGAMERVSRGTVFFDRCPSGDIWLEHGTKDALFRLHAEFDDDEVDALFAASLRSDPLSVAALREGRGSRSWLTSLLFALSAVVLVASMAAPKWFAIFGVIPSQLGAHPWTLLTHSLFHVGVIHFLMNGMYLLALGAPLERFLGTNRFLLLWVASVVAGGLGHAALDLSSTIPMVGASTGVSGLYGAFLVLNAVVTPGDRKTKTTKVVMATLVFVVLQLGIGSFDAGIAWMGHLGGFVCGVLLGLVFRASELQRGAPHAGQRSSSPA